MTTLCKPLWVGTVVAALTLSGCFGSSEDLEQGLEEALGVDQAADETVTDETETDGQDEAEPAGAAVQIAERSLDSTVFYAGLEFHFGAVEVTDLDADSDGARSQGIEMVFNVDVHNPLNQTATPTMPVTLQWDEPGTGNVIEVNGTPDIRQAPAGASSSGTVTVTLPPADLELYDDASARLIVGASHRATAQVPVGANAELITRAPVDQPQLEGVALEAGPVTITLDGGEVRWQQGGNQVAEGEPLFELYFTVTNDSEHQSCFPRGEGATLVLVDASGGGYADLRLDERCYSGGTSGENVTGFVVDGDWAGDYTLALHEVQVYADVFDGEVALTLVDG